MVLHRRKFMKTAVGAVSAAFLPTTEAIACAGDESIEDILLIETPKNYLNSFQFSTVADFLDSTYGQNWEWSEELQIISSNSVSGGSGYGITENPGVVAIEVTLKESDGQDTYISGFDILYKDATDSSSPDSSIYIASSFELSASLLPYLNMRLKMTSIRADIYGVAFVSSKSSNRLIKTKVSKIPIKLTGAYCGGVEYKYVDV